MADWQHAQQDASEVLAQIHVFSMKKKGPSGEVDFRITISRSTPFLLPGSSCDFLPRPTSR